MKKHIINNKIIFGIIIFISILLLTTLLYFGIIKYMHSTINKNPNIEILIEKTQEKSFVEIETNKKIYNSKEKEKENININIEPKKNVVIEDSAPLFYRTGDKIEIGTNIFNNTDNKIGFKVHFESKDIEVEKPIRNIFIEANSSKIVNFWTKSNLDKIKDIKYTILVVGDNIKNSDKFEKNLENKKFPNIGNTIVRGGLAEKGKQQHFKINIPENTDFKKSKVKISFSNNLLEGKEEIETSYTFAKLNKAEIDYNKLLKGVEKNNLSRHELIYYTYGLIIGDKKENKELIKKNIVQIIENFENNENIFEYWSKKSDKAIFATILIDYGYDEKVIIKYIKELYGIDWSNYYYSTTAKNNTYIAFSKYMEKYGNNSSSNFAFSIGYIQNRDKRFWLGGKKENIITREFNLYDIIQYKEDFIELTTFILSGEKFFTNLALNIVPEDKLKIKETSNGMNISREFYELNSGKEIINGVFNKGKIYKVKININFDEEKQRKNLILEDYIPSTFKVINSKENNNILGSWTKIEYLKDKVLVNSNNLDGKTIQFEYTVIPQFRGNYIYPPVNTYMKYNGDINAHSKYEKIKVK
ncbi:MAG: hypothetical protein Q9M94_07340 [Candidatus Gracilibacteria bacterium]|nr:hypothetical protein [Candidatus Gracilibacteria bacterium]